MPLAVTRSITRPLIFNAKKKIYEVGEEFQAGVESPSLGIPDEYRRHYHGPGAGGPDPGAGGLETPIGEMIGPNRFWDPNSMF
jgi:hypothetical protein